MPELPEIETIKRVLEPQLNGMKIKDIVVNKAAVIAYPEAAQFYDRLVGQEITGLGRCGKFLYIHLQSGDEVIFHLRMTGSLLLMPELEPFEKHTHVVFELDDGKKQGSCRACLRFIDPRRFGRIWLIRQGEDDTFSGVHKLGPEPFDRQISAQYLQQRCGNSRRAIKGCLLDQSIIAGIGNIYSDEILFTAMIHPARSANTLSGEEWQRLAEIIPERLDYFIEKNAITPEAYLQSKGKEYRNTPYLQVYGHSQEPCPVCGESLCKITVGGRSSVFCPGCQKAFI